MEISIDENRGNMIVWLTKAESSDAELQQKLKPLYADYKKKKYTVAVFQSGEKDLYSNTLDLLKYNKRRAAEIEVAREKLQRETLSHR